MDEQGFDFRKAPQRREPKRFEPPPWEREAFEAIRGARESDRPEAGGQSPQSVEVAAPEVPEALTEEPEEAGTEEQSAEERTRTGPDEAQVLEMLARLAAEETEETRAVSKAAFNVTVGVSITLGAIGMMVLMWGMAMFTEIAADKRMGVTIAAQKPMGAWTTGFVGAGLLGLAVWLLYRMLRQRGVL